MEKPAPADHPIHDLLRQRWSPRAFSGQPVPPEVLRSLLEAARWAASGANRQPWRYLLATRDEPAEYERLLACLNESNQRWAGRAPVLMVAVAQTVSPSSGKPSATAMHDVGLANAQMWLEAGARGLVMHMMGGIDRQRIREVYGVPEGHEVIAAMAIGYPGDPDTLPEDLAERERQPRERHPLAHIVFHGGWEKPANLD